MKRLFFLLCTTMAFFSACSSLPLRDRTPHQATTKDLAGKRFVLSMFDGNTVQVEEGEGYELSFNDSMQISAKGCNRFFGKATLENGILKAPQAASTRMYCAESFANNMDTILSSLFENGSQVIMERGKLKLSVDGHALTYIPSTFQE